MALTNSNNIPMGMIAKEFKLKNVINNEQIALTEYAKDTPIVIAFICNHCPYVKHIINRLVEIGNNYEKNVIKFIAMSSNNAEKYPEDSEEKMKLLSIEKNMLFPYCYDESQIVAKKYKAACTPDIYLFDRKHQLVYHGQFDSAQLNSTIPVTGEDLINAIEQLVRGKKISSRQIPSLGCSIKWKG